MTGIQNPARRGASLFPPRSSLAGLYVGPAPLRRGRRAHWTAWLAALAACGGLSGTPPARSAAVPTERIAFYGDIGNVISTRNPLLIRPETVLLAEDGSIALVNLHWRSWGADIAQASGLWRASNCTPDCATGRLTTQPARLTLSDPGYVDGHRVYRCYQVQLAAGPRDRLRACLQKQGSFYLYAPIAHSPASRVHPHSTCAAVVAFAPAAPGRHPAALRYDSPARFNLQRSVI